MQWFLTIYYSLAFLSSGTLHGRLSGKEVVGDILWELGNRVTETSLTDEQQPGLAQYEMLYRYHVSNAVSFFIMATLLLNMLFMLWFVMTLPRRIKKWYALPARPTVLLPRDHLYKTPAGTRLHYCRGCPALAPIDDKRVASVQVCTHCMMIEQTRFEMELQNHV